MKSIASHHLPMLFICTGSQYFLDFHSNKWRAQGPIQNKQALFLALEMERLKQ